MNPPTHVLYLHGFRSSPSSAKAQFSAAWFAMHHPEILWCCPQLPASPKDSAALINALVQNWPHHSTVVIGSSLGGFYATWVAAKFGCKAVLLNPAVHPARDLAKYIGEHPVWHKPEEKIFFDPSYIDELKDLYVGKGLMQLTDSTIEPRLQDAPDMLAVIATGDEVLDWREMHAAYGHDRVRLIEGSDHAISDFEVYLPGILAFLGLS